MKKPTQEKQELVPICFKGDKQKQHITSKWCNHSVKEESDWEKEYSRIIGRYGNIPDPNKDLTEFNSGGWVMMKDFIKQTISTEVQKKVKEIKDYVEDDLALLGITHGRSRMKGSWINKEDLIKYLDNISVKKVLDTQLKKS